MAVIPRQQSSSLPSDLKDLSISLSIKNRKTNEYVNLSQTQVDTLLDEYICEGKFQINDSEHTTKDGEQFIAIYLNLVG